MVTVALGLVVLAALTDRFLPIAMQRIVLGAALAGVAALALESSTVDRIFTAALGALLVVALLTRRAAGGGGARGAIAGLVLGAAGLSFMVVLSYGVAWPIDVVENELFRCWSGWCSPSPGWSPSWWSCATMRRTRPRWPSSPPRWPG